MSNNVYETAKINYAKKLKENENAIRRLKTKLEKSMKNDPKAQEYQKRLEEFNGDLEENKDEFVRDTKYALSKVFFSTLLYGASDEIKIINEYPDIIDLSFLEVLHQDLYRLDYDGCVKILKDEGLKNTFNLENKESGLAKAYQQIQRTIEECEKETNKCLLDCIALDKKRKRFSFFKTANYNKKIQRKINERYQDFQEYDMLQKALISLSKKIKKACETYNSLAENLDSNKNYANVKLNQSL